MMFPARVSTRSWSTSAGPSAIPTTSPTSATACTAWTPTSSCCRWSRTSRTSHCCGRSCSLGERTRGSRLATSTTTPPRSTSSCSTSGCCATTWRWSFRLWRRRCHSHLIWSALSMTLCCSACSWAMTSCLRCRRWTLRRARWTPCLTPTRLRCLPWVATSQTPASWTACDLRPSWRRWGARSCRCWRSVRATHRTLKTRSSAGKRRRRPSRNL
mmetsp:Transcript_17580/g.45721  ORF Transcript_17580/g.45721 Transcript_17580/m.45721 type:complete len:214 (+) Transcript_17580:596-1237(+)